MPHTLPIAALLAAALAPATPATQHEPRPNQPRPSLPREVMAAISPGRTIEAVQALASFGTRHTLSETESPDRGIGAARNWIKARLEGYGPEGESPLQVSFEGFDAPPGARLPDGATVVNVVAVLPGTMPEAADRLYYVVGHYDSRASDPQDARSDAPGANDDASGVAVVLEVARALVDRGPLESTVVFLCTAGEEQGLYGARYHADTAAAEGAKVMGVLSNDIVGDPTAPEGVTPTPGGRGLVRVFSEGVPRNPTAQQAAQLRALSAEHDSPSRQLARYIAEVAALEGTRVRPKLVFRPDRFLRGGDHTPFLERGFPAVRFTEVDEHYDRQHQDIRDEVGDDGRTRRFGDLPEFVDPGYVADVARLNAAVLVHLANAPSPPPRARIITANLTNDTTLRWDPSPEPDVAGYEVVWRDTTAPFWEHTRDVGSATEATLDLCKDDWFFGVRAYDRDGYRSPVSFPSAARD